MPTTTRLALQGDLLSLLGFGALELIATVLPERVRVKDDLKRLLAAAEHAEADGSSSGGLGGSGGAGGGPAAPVGCMVKLTTKSQQVLEKQRRKDATKLALHCMQVLTTALLPHTGAREAKAQGRDETC